jgi:Pyruvate-formate lyase-activating enzyme
MIKGLVASFESFATMDGGGIRFAVFMGGCPLRCAYCHNPDFQGSKGTYFTPEELADKIKRYKPYFKSGGGATFTGGEPIIQAEFLIEVVKLLNREGVKSAIDTAAPILNENAKELYSVSDLVVADLKFPTREGYVKYCGSDAFGTVIRTLDFLSERNIKTLLRTVIVPGINDTFADIDSYYDLVKNYKNLTAYELKPFHTLGFSKYEKLGLKNPLAGKEALPAERLKELQIHLDFKLKSLS